MAIFTTASTVSIAEAQEITTGDYCLKKGHWEHLPMPNRPLIMVCDDTGNSFCSRPCETITVNPE